MVIRLSNSIPSSSKALKVLFQDFTAFAFLWQDDINAEYAKFLSKGPNLLVSPAQTPCRYLLMDANDVLCWRLSIATHGSMQVM